jgi:ribonuclease HII
MIEKFLQEEKKLWKKRYKYVVGLDEAGRGSLAGPVVATAVMIKNPKKLIKNLICFKGMRDSKKTSVQQREKLYKILTSCPDISWATARVSEKKIDKINILEASKLAMIKAIERLRLKPDFLIIDGNFKLNLLIKQKSIIKADEKVFSCMAAGIISKVFRDRIMKNYSEKFPQYNFDKNKGYPVKKHFIAIKKHSLCSIHRKTFRTIKN